MDTEKRLLIAILLSMAILLATPYLYQAFFPSPPAAAPQTPATLPAAQEDRPGEPAPIQQEAEPAPPERPATPTRTAASPQSVQVENEDMILRWSNVGAVLESARLKHYATEAGEPLELIPQGLPEGLPRPLSLRASDQDVSEELSAAVYELQGVTGESLKAPAEITFHYEGDEIEVTRTIRVPVSGYTLEFETEVRERGRAIPHSVVLGPGIGRQDQVSQDFTYPRLVYFSKGSTVAYTADDLEGAAQQLEISPSWVAQDSQYFAYALLNPDGIRQVRFRLEGDQPGDPQAEQSPAALLVAEVGLDASPEFDLFIGPKDGEILRNVDPTLGELIDYGWFALIVKPLLFSLKFIYGFVQNYGWAIIILTFMINLLLWPVRHKQMSSMKKMSELQPQLKSIQDKYKNMKRDDPRRQQMNQEVMGLYQQHGVNPLGGCLPLVIQMPILFAFYTMLAYSIELRGAPFILWIDDLSRHDPYYATPIVMGASMRVQQVMTPSAGDPTQRKMMLALPVIFTFFFLSVSSGLALYFLFSNVFAIMFQVLMQKWNPEQFQVNRASKKSRKKAGRAK